MAHSRSETNLGGNCDIGDTLTTLPPTSKPSGSNYLGARKLQKLEKLWGDISRRGDIL